MKTKIYFWQGVNANGKKCSGVIDAANSAIVKQQLQTQNILPLQIHKRRGKKITHKHIVDFSRQLATMIDAGIPILRALQILAASADNANMQALLTSLGNDVTAGSSLSAAIKKWPQYFDTLFSSLIYAGEQSGTLNKMLLNIATYQEKSVTLKRKLLKAMLYPTIVLLLALGVTAVLLIFVVPQFTNLFANFGAALPLYTQFIIAISDFFTANYIYLGLAILALPFIYKLLRCHSPKFSFFIDKITLQIPVFGKLTQQGIVAKISRALAITFAAGITLDQALQLVIGLATNKIYANALSRIQEDIVNGKTVATALEQSKVFDQRIVQMVHVGEESGSLDIMLDKIATYYEDEVNYTVDNLSSLLEPAIMTFLGVLIGGLIIGMYLPIFKLGTLI